MTLHTSLREILDDACKADFAREEIVESALTSITDTIIKRVEGMKMDAVLEDYWEWYDKAITDIIALLKGKE